MQQQLLAPLVPKSHVQLDIAAVISTTLELINRIASLLLLATGPI
jgi:hypothetical protein